MLEKLIAPTVVGIVVCFVSLFGTDVKQLLLPDHEVTYKVTSSKRLLGPEDVGRKEIPILGKNVSGVYLTQVDLKNSGKKSINEIEILLDINSAKKLELYRVFYITKPEEMFGDIDFSNYKSKLSKKIKIKEFVEGNEITVSLISSELLELKFIANKAGVSFKEFTEEDSIEEHTYVAIVSALSVIAGRLLIDLLGVLVALYRRRAH
jgi:hypothetical protein